MNIQGGHRTSKPRKNLENQDFIFEARNASKIVKNGLEMAKKPRNGHDLETEKDKERQFYPKTGDISRKFAPAAPLLLFDVFLANTPLLPS